MANPDNVRTAFFLRTALGTKAITKDLGGQDFFRNLLKGTKPPFCTVFSKITVQRNLMNLKGKSAFCTLVRLYGHF